MSAARCGTFCKVTIAPRAKVTETIYVDASRHALEAIGQGIGPARSKKSGVVALIELPQRNLPACGPFEVQISGPDRLAAVEWPAIDDSRDLRMYVFQSRDFLQVWLDTIGRAAHIDGYLVIVKDGEGKPVLFLPLAIETKFNTRLLRFMDSGVADYNAPILVPGLCLSRPAFHALWSEILALLPAVDAIDLKKIAAHVCGMRNPFTYLDCAPGAEDGHWLPLAVLHSEVDARRSVVTLRRNLRRFSRGLARVGPMQFTANPTGASATPIVDRLLELKRQRYIRSNVADFLAQPGVENFYRAMTAPSRLGRISHLCALTAGGSVASAHLGFIGRGRFYYIFPAYDTAFQRYRPGHLLLQHLIDRCCDEAFIDFDLGVGDFVYKNAWATQRLQLFSYERAVTATGRIYLQMRRVRRLVQCATRPWLRTGN